MAYARTIPALVLLAAFASAQMPVTQTAALPSPGSQANSSGASFSVSAIVQSPGELPSPTVTVLTPTSVSTTLAYVAVGSVPTSPSPGSITLTGSLNGAPSAPCALALSVQPGSSNCGGFAGAPCMTAPLLFGSTPTAFGVYHLDANPIIIFDGIGSAGPPLSLDANGSLALSATGAVDTTTNGGVELNFAIQAAVMDPTAISGVSLTACLTVNQWIFY